MKKIIWLLLLPILLLSCNVSEQRPDFSQLNTHINLYRFDSVLFAQKVENLESDLEQWNREHGVFMDVYSQQMIQLGSPLDSKFPYYFRSFLNDTVIRQVMTETNVRFQDFEPLRNDIVQALNMYAYYFNPNLNVQVYFTVSGFNQSVLASDSLAIISLEKYLGAGHKFYGLLGIDKYKRLRMHQARISPDLLTALLYNQFEFDAANGNALLNSMIYEGKIQYALRKMLPDVADTVLWNYTELQWKWANTNEENIWTYTVEQEKLYEVETEQIRKFVGEGPFTAPLGQNSAPRSLVFIGYKIVESYMELHPEVSLLSLMQMQNAQQILEQARYKP